MKKRVKKKHRHRYWLRSHKDNMAIWRADLDAVKRKEQEHE